ncbi:MAG: glycosyltransferase [Clostridia bacterium]
MNILIFNNREMIPTIGGIERISCSLAVEFIQRGHNVWFASTLKADFDFNGQLPSKQYILPSENVLVTENIKLLTNIITDNKIDIVINQSAHVIECVNLCAKACDKNAKLVSVLHFNPTFVLMLSKNLPFSKVVNSKNFHDYICWILKPIFHVKRKRYLKKIYSAAAKNSSKLILLSDNYKSEILNYIDIKDEYKVVGINNFTETQTQIINDEKKNTLLYVGRLDFGQKRPDRIIEIWENIYKKYPDWKLKIAGDGPLKDDLMKYVARKNIQNIEFLGFVNLEKEYEKAKILCMTSTYEGLPMVLIEGANYGCVPIAFDSFASLHDIIDNEENGIIVEKFNLKEYQRKLEKLMFDEKYRAMIQKQSFKINEKFNKEKIITQWLELFENLVSEYV